MVVRIALLLLVAGSTLGFVSKRQVLDDSDSSSSGGDGLASILGTSANTVLSRASLDVETRAVKGNGCTTPQSTQGVCSYITDPECAEVLSIIQQVGVTQRIISYLRQAIQPPCGLDSLDYTMCCEGTPSVQPPVVTQPPTVTSAPSTAICGINDKTRIVNGQESKLGDWPWAVIVGKPKDGNSFQVICGGTLINERYVLTASHCFVGQVTQSSHVRLGELDISNPNDGAQPEDVPIERVITHPSYTSTALQNDIALLRLNRNVVFRSGLRPACLPDQYAGFDLTTLRTPPVVVGWGSTVTGGSTVNALREAHIQVIPKAQCETSYAPVSRIKISDTQICAGTGDRDTCTGDSGGPMLSDQFGRFTVVGITSFGVKCADAKFPGVYTRVDRFLDWIRSNMN